MHVTLLQLATEKGDALVQAEVVGSFDRLSESARACVAPGRSCLAIVAGRSL